jgi:ATP-dependent DNA ligase
LGSVVLDGELVGYGPSGRLQFPSLNYGARRRAAEGVRLIYATFDLLAYRGRDLRDRTYRRAAGTPETILGPRSGGTVQLMTATDDPGRAAGWVSAEQAAVGVEGCVAKPLTSRYSTRSGRAGWIKVRYFEDTDAVVLGPTQPRHRGRLSRDDRCVAEPSANPVQGVAGDPGVVAQLVRESVRPVRRTSL